MRMTRSAPLRRNLPAVQQPNGGGGGGGGGGGQDVAQMMHTGVVSIRIPNLAVDGAGSGGGKHSAANGSGMLDPQREMLDALAALAL